MPATPAPTLRALLDHAVETGVVTRKALAIAAECDEETVRRWLAGQTPRTTHLRRMVGRASLLPDTLKVALLEWFLRGSDYRAMTAAECDRTMLDPNGDGIVDARDTSVFALRSIEQSAAAANDLRRAATGGRLNEAERSAARAALHSAAEAIRCGLAALDADEGPTCRVA